MIQNQREYNVTKGQIELLESARIHSQTAEGKVDPRVYRAMIAGIEDQLRELREQLHEYDELGRARSLSLTRTEDLPQTLVKARVARGYTQKELAKRLNVRPQQVQRYEATGYRSASLKRVLEVMRALDLKLEAEIPLR
ncbi:MAG: transcriptional regulator [Armatimonadetes bacterium CG_4_10_14_3_um_filter_66_18]|nr:helix-turn-helix transcriptional regulator [Armatimonadota bacterium]OIP00986.1 MAG: hypothetical protein AUJ96_18110 [Armatimonadetes bacterium CG2_30_66_41]PIU87912.1 MAG: transcriptional regulator [Armatimonadetes bacterium CG06_land_8_20_14_3_00_66_21]PIX39781.1 MAG: transcriptional regulator [Armatimonadetes bacterium CG_4_8_14_3_um_filter_66_20]PIY43959.1 MAG: transcriptional regulator [Armatimonadetes bacterium CG_4_10_14_3_um_filter_66_18]PIZ45593.1 MAG: transcriptional regulator [A